VLYGYCGGHFSNTYGDKRVEAVGADWVVARDNYGNVYLAECRPEELEQYTVDRSGEGTI
jgi:hypothetical protein